MTVKSAKYIAFDILVLTVTMLFLWAFMKPYVAPQILVSPLNGKFYAVIITSYFFFKRIYYDRLKSKPVRSTRFFNRSLLFMNAGLLFLWNIIAFISPATIEGKIYTQDPFSITYGKMHFVVNASNAFKERSGRYPTSITELVERRALSLGGEECQDGWGDAFSFENIGSAFRLCSSGKDGIWNTSDDIQYYSESNNWVGSDQYVRIIPTIRNSDNPGTDGNPGTAYHFKE